MVTWEKEKSYLQTDDRLHRTPEGAEAHGKWSQEDQPEEAVLCSNELNNKFVPLQPNPPKSKAML